MLTPDMRAVIESAHLCFAATVTPDGRPNLSPKGTLRVCDDDRLFFLDIASPGTRANLAHSPWLELNVVDQLSRRGYRFAGRAELHEKESVVYGDAIRRIYGGGGATTPVAAVVLITIERAAKPDAGGALPVMAKAGAARMRAARAGRMRRMRPRISLGDGALSTEADKRRRTRRRNSQNG